MHLLIVLRATVWVRGPNSLYLVEISKNEALLQASSSVSVWFHRDKWDCSTCTNRRSGTKLLIYLHTMSHCASKLCWLALIKFSRSNMTKLSLNLASLDIPKELQIKKVSQLMISWLLKLMVKYLKPAFLGKKKIIYVVLGSFYVQKTKKI